MRHLDLMTLGEECFEWIVLERDVQTREELDRLETLYVQKYDSVHPNGYNQVGSGRRRKKVVYPTPPKVVLPNGGITMSYSHGRATSSPASGVTIVWMEWTGLCAIILSLAASTRKQSATHNTLNRLFPHMAVLPKVSFQVFPILIR